MATKAAKKKPVDDDIALTKEQQLMLSTRSLIHRLKNPQDGLPVSHETAAILDVIFAFCAARRSAPNCSESGRPILRPTENESSNRQSFNRINDTIEKKIEQTNHLNSIDFTA